MWVGSKLPTALQAHWRTSARYINNALHEHFAVQQNSICAQGRNSSPRDQLLSQLCPSLDNHQPFITCVATITPRMARTTAQHRQSNTASQPMSLLGAVLLPPRPRTRERYAITDESYNHHCCHHNHMLRKTCCQMQVTKRKPLCLCGHRPKCAASTSTTGY